MDTGIKFVSAFKRSSAVSIDITIVLLIRIIVAQILGSLWLNNQIADFFKEFHDHFGTEFIHNNPDHIAFISHHKIFHSMIIFYAILLLIGAVYHAYLNSSKWQATIGKRLLKIMVAKEDGSRISFLQGFAHYFLSLLPVIFIIYLVSFTEMNHVNFFSAITANIINIFFSALTVLWVQVQIFTKKRTTLYDLICKLMFIEGKTVFKFPWK